MPKDIRLGRKFRNSLHVRKERKKEKQDRNAAGYHELGSSINLLHRPHSALKLLGLPVHSLKAPLHARTNKRRVRGLA